MGFVAGTLYMFWMKKGLVETSELRIRNSEGETVAAFGVTDDGSPAFYMKNKDGQVAVSLTVLENASFLRIGTEESPRVHLAAESNTKTWLLFSQPDETDVALRHSDEHFTVMHADKDGVNGRIRIERNGKLTLSEEWSKPP